MVNCLWEAVAPEFICGGESQAQYRQVHRECWDQGNLNGKEHRRFPSRGLETPGTRNPPQWAGTYKD